MKIVVALTTSCFLGVSSSVMAFSSSTTSIRRTTTTKTGHLFAGLVEGGGDKPPQSSPTAPSFGNAMNINPGLITDRNQVISEPFGNAVDTINPGLLSDRINQDISQPLATMGRDQKKKGNMAKKAAPTKSNNNNNNIGQRITMDEKNWEDILGPATQFAPYVKQMNTGEEAASLDEIVYRQLERGVWVSSPGNRDFNRGYNREFTTMYYM